MGFQPVENRKLLGGHLAWFLVWLIVTVIAVILTPNPQGHGTHTQLGLAPCPSALIMHRPCPGCGLTTSFTATVHGDIGLAFTAHPLGPILYLFATASALACFYGWLTKRKFATDTPAFNKSLGALIVVFLVFSTIRFAVVSDYSSGFSPRKIVKNR